MRSKIIYLMTAILTFFIGVGTVALVSSFSPHASDSVLIKNFYEHEADFNLLVTGGSDYHGENKPDIRLGTGRAGNLCVPDALLATLKSTGPPLTSS